MSGGSMDYLCFKIQDGADYVSDKEVNELMLDLADLLHDLEWYTSGDYSRSDYDEALMKFKRKWFGENRNERLKEYLNTTLDNMKCEIEKML